MALEREPDPAGCKKHGAAKCYDFSFAKRVVNGTT